MYTIHATNVNQALPSALMLLRDSGVPVGTRNGAAIRVPTPVSTIYDRPHERVLFNPVRNANPFFHFFEALWILAGQKDVAFLAQFNERIKDYSDDGITFHAPYGYRLRRHFGYDQVERVISMLNKNPATRQAVLQIWDTVEDLDTVSKDIPCNDLVMLDVRDDGCLHIMVCNRSNDVIWGCYGANVVQFSMLQEYIAARTFVGIGTYTQVSYNFHVYTDNPYWQHFLATCPVGVPLSHDAYHEGEVAPYPLFQDANFDLDLNNFFSFGSVNNARTEAFSDVVVPILAAWKAHKERDYVLAQERISACAASDWRLACADWLRRVEAKFLTKGYQG